MFLIFYMNLQLHDFFGNFFLGGERGEGGKVNLVLGFSDQNYLS